MEGVDAGPTAALTGADELVFPNTLDTSTPSNLIDDTRQGRKVEPSFQQKKQQQPPLDSTEAMAIRQHFDVRSTIAPNRNDERAFIQGWLDSTLGKKEAQMTLSFCLASQGIQGEPAYDLNHIGISRQSLSNDPGLDETVLDNLYRGLHLHSIAFRRMVIKETSNLLSQVTSQIIQRNDQDAAYIQQKARSNFLKIYNGFNLAHFAIVSALVDTPYLQTCTMATPDIQKKENCNEGDLRLLLEAKGSWELKVQILQKVIEKEREERRNVEALLDQARQSLDKAQQDIEKEKDAHRETSQKLSEEIHTLEGNCEQLRTDLHESMEKTKLEQQAHQEAKAKFARDMIICEEMKEQNQSLNSAIQSRLAEIAQKNEDIADLQQTIQDKDKMLSDEVAKNEEIESSLDSLTKLLNTEKLKTKAIQALFEEESNLSSRTQARKDELEKECEELKEIVESKSAENEKLTIDLEKSEKSLAALEIQAKDLAEELSCLKLRERKLDALVKHNNKQHLFRERNSMHIEDDRARMLIYIHDQQKNTKEMARKMAGNEKVARKALAKDSLLVQKLEEASTHLEAKTATAEGLLLDLDTARMAVTRSETTSEELRTELKDTRAIVKLNESTIEEQERELGILRRANITLKGKEQKAIADLRSLKKESHEGSESFQIQISTYEEKITALEEECTLLRSGAIELQVLQEVHKNLQEELQSKNELLAKQNNSIEDLLDEKHALQDRVAQMLADSKEAQRKIRNLEVQFNTITDNYDKQVIAYKDATNELRELRDRHFKLSEEHEETLRELALSKKNYDVQGEEKADLERWSEDMKATNASMSAQVKALEERTDLTEKLLVSQSAKNKESLKELSRSLDQLNNERTLVIQHVNILRSAIQNLGDSLPEDVTSRFEVGLLFQELVQQSNWLGKQLMDEDNSDRRDVGQILQLCKQDMDSSIQNYNDLMNDLQTAKEKSTADMISQDTEDQTGWSSVETWLTEEREKQKSRIIERDANQPTEIPKSSVKKRAEVAEERSASLELDLKRLEKKLESAFEALESKGKQCVEYATKHKEVQIKADRQEVAVQKLEEQLQTIKLERRDVKSSVHVESEGLQMQLQRESTARQWQEKYMRDLSKRLVDAQNRLKALNAQKIESRASQTDAAEIWARNAQAAPPVQKTTSSSSIKDLSRVWNSRTPTAVTASATSVTSASGSSSSAAAAVAVAQQQSSTGDMSLPLPHELSHSHGHGRWLSVKAIMDTIYEIYAAKIKFDALAADERREPVDLSCFTYTFFSEKYGLLELTDQRLGEFTTAVAYHQASIWEVEQFGLATGIVKDNSDPLGEGQPPEGVARVLNRASDSADELALSLATSGSSSSSIDPSLKQRSIDIDNAIQSNLYSQPLIRHKQLMGLDVSEINTHPLASKVLSERPQRRRPFIDRLIGESSAPLIVHPIMLDAISVAERDAGWVLEKGCDLALHDYIREQVDMGVAIGSTQLPQLQYLVREVCEMLEMAPAQIYIIEHPRPAAFPWYLQTGNAAGLRQTCKLVLTSCLMDLLEPAELQAVIAGNLGILKSHEKNQHPSDFLCYVRGITAARWHLLVSPLPDMDISDHLRDTISLFWQALNFCIDRVALIVTQDLRAVASAALKTAAGVHTLCNQLNLDAVWEQAKQLDSSTVRCASNVCDSGNSNNNNDNKVLLRLDDIYKASQSVVVIRLRELKRWAATPEYDQAFVVGGGVEEQEQEQQWDSSSGSNGAAAGVQTKEENRRPRQGRR